MKKGRHWAFWLIAMTLVAASCSGSEDAGDTSRGLSLDEVYAEVDGLTGDARRARLIELAAKEDSDITLYTSISIDDTGAVIDSFDDALGIGIDLYRASAATVVLRVMQEADADVANADVVILNGSAITALDDADLLAPLKTPLTEDITPGAVYENWSGVYLQIFVASWNTNALSADEVPETWEDVLANYPGTLAMELDDFDWFSTLVKDYFIERKGLTEDEAVALFQRAAEGALVIDGHTLMAELLAAGSFDVAASPYEARITRLNTADAPVDWQPAVEPLIVRPNGIAIHRDTGSPATALLFVEYMLTEGQTVLADIGRTPANTTVAGGLAPGFDVIAVDLEELAAERTKWVELYEEVISRSGQGVTNE